MKCSTSKLQNNQRVEANRQNKSKKWVLSLTADHLSRPSNAINTFKDVSMWCPEDVNVKNQGVNDCINQHLMLDNNSFSNSSFSLDINF